MELLSDRYELGPLLGAGGMARVVEGHDRVLDRKVAVKLLRDDIAMDTSARDRFLREARTAAKFTHPNAVAVYDTGQDGKTPWIVMELLKGEDLSQRLARTGRLAEEEAVRIADAVLAALEAAHRDGMVHRDVKPANIMLLDEGGVKLTDFGIAKSLRDATAGLTATGQVIGTAKYLSPEQVEGRPAAPASDLYATGVVLYEMLAGQPPFTGDSTIAVALAHTREPVPDLRKTRPDVSQRTAGVASRAMAKDPDARFADAQQMRQALAGEPVPVAAPAAASTRVLAAEQPTTRLPPATPARRAPWVLITLAALALLGAVWLANNAPTGDQAAEEPNEPPAEEPDEGDQPADEEPTDEPTDEPSDPPVEPEPPTPTDLPELIGLLAANPGTYGVKQGDLRDELVKVLDREGDKQAEEARKVMERTAEWADKGELDGDIAAVAIQLLEPYLSASDEPDEGRGREDAPGQDDDGED